MHSPMLERETELIKQIILESTIGGRSSIRLNEVIASPLPRGVKTFISAEVLKLLETEFKQSSPLSRIARNTDALVLPDRAVLRALAMEYVLERDEYAKLVEDTVHFLENYLCRPQWTLTQMLFENDSQISFETMVKKFECTADYSYFGALLERYARRNGWTTITRDQFEKVIARIDEEIVKQHTPKQIALLTQPIFDFLLFGNISMTRPVPVGAIFLFYDDKKLPAVKNYVERICQVRSRTQISMGELIEIIEDLYRVESTVKDDVAESEQAIFAPREPEEQAAQEIVPEQAETPAATQLESTVFPLNEVQQPAELSESLENQTTESEPVNAQAENLLPDEIFPEQTPESATSPIHEPENLSLDTGTRRADKGGLVNPGALIAYATEREAQRHALFLTFPDPPIKREPPSHLPLIEQLASDLQQEKFARIIFGDNEQYFRAFLVSINNTCTWGEAQLLLRELFEMRKLNILSPDVVEFTDVMHARYRTELKPAE